MLLRNDGDLRSKPTRGGSVSNADAAGDADAADAADATDAADAADHVNGRHAWGDPPALPDRGAYSLRLRILCESTKQALNDSVGRMLELARKVGLDTDEHPELEIALREAVANAIIHGNDLGDGKQVFVRCYGAPGQGAMFLVRDEGPGFDPGDVPDPRAADRKELHHGRGVFLMRELMDFVAYRRGGREVLLYKACD